MKLPLFALSLVAAFGCLAAEPEFAPLFNGKDLTGFKAEGSTGFWRVENGVLIGENDAAKKGNYLWTEKEYGDFVIEFDVRWKGTTPRGVDTGIEMRKPKIQLQLGISGSLKVDMTGSFYTGKYPEEGQAKEAKQAPETRGRMEHLPHPGEGRHLHVLDQRQEGLGIHGREILRRRSPRPANPPRRGDEVRVSEHPHRPALRGCPGSPLARSAASKKILFS